MNDHDPIHRLDDRATRAATDVRDRAAARRRPSFDPARPVDLPTPVARPDRSAPRRVLAIAAAVVLLAGAAGWWATASDEDAGPATTTGEGLRPHVATDLPAGLAPAGAFHRGDVEPDDVTGPGAAIAAAFYGPADDDPQLAVASGADLAEADEGLGAPVDLGGGLVARPLGETFGLPGVLVTGTPEPVILLSRSLSTGALGEIAPSVRFDDGRPEVAADGLPDGWRLRTREPDLLAAAFPMSATAAAGEQYGAAYVAESETGTDGPEVDDRMAIVLSLPGDDARRASARLLLDDVEDVEVQGEPALVGRSPEGGDPSGEELWTVAWLARPGTLVRVSAYGLDRSETLRVAEGVRPAEGDEWDVLERLTEERSDQRDVASGQPDGSAGTELGRGTFPDGTDWVLRTADGGIGTELTVGDGGLGGSTSSSGEPGAVAFRSFETTDRGARRFGSGLLTDGVDAVELRRTDGSVIGRAVIVVGSGDRAWVAELTEDPVVVVALDGDGRELDRREVEDADPIESVGDGVDGSDGPVPSTIVGQGTPLETTVPAGSTGSTGTGGSGGG